MTKKRRHYLDSLKFARKLRREWLEKAGPLQVASIYQLAAAHRKWLVEQKKQEVKP